MISEWISVLIWFAGVLDFLGMIGGLLFLTVLAWMAFTRRGRYALGLLWQMPEYRCYICVLRDNCYAAGTGPLYPCPHYAKEKDKP